MDAIEKKVLSVMVIIIGLVVLFVMWGHSQGQLDYQICGKKGGELIYTDYGSVCVKKGTIL